MSLPDENEVERALLYLAQTDEPYAQSVSRVKALEHRVKVIKSVEFISAKGTMAEKDAKAISSPEYKGWIEDYENAIADMETMRAKRKRAELEIDLFRTLESSRRMGK